MSQSKLKALRRNTHTHTHTHTQTHTGLMFFFNQDNMDELTPKSKLFWIFNEEMTGWQ